MVQELTEHGVGMIFWALTVYWTPTSRPSNGTSWPARGFVKQQYLLLCLVEAENCYWLFNNKPCNIQSTLLYIFSHPYRICRLERYSVSAYCAIVHQSAELHRGGGHIVCWLGKRQLTIQVAESAARLRTAALSAASLHGTAQQNVLLLYCWSFMAWSHVSGSERHFCVWWGGGITLLEGFLASPAHPSGRSSMKMKMYEGVKMVTVVAWNKGHRILISHWC